MNLTTYLIIAGIIYISLHFIGTLHITYEVNGVERVASILTVEIFYILISLFWIFILIFMVLIGVLFLFCLLVMIIVKIFK